MNLLESMKGMENRRSEAALFGDLLQEEMLQGSSRLEEEGHEMIGVQEILEDGFLGQGEALLLDQESPGLADDFVPANPIRAILRACPAEKALGEDLVIPLGVFGVAFLYGFNQGHLSPGRQGFFQRFQVDRALGQTVPAFHAPLGFFLNFV